MLSELHRQKYLQLAVFLDDDLIPAAALEMLWGVDKYEVEDTMAMLSKKSLALAEYNPLSDGYVYSLHDLQLDYLKNMLAPAEEQAMHRALVEKYFRRAAYRYGDLEDDGYILTHLGYHMLKAGMQASFPEVYLDLNYVEVVLKACGTACLLNDYRKYGHLIGKCGGCCMHVRQMGSKIIVDQIISIVYDGKVGTEM